MTITTHRCQCHELSSGLCCACEWSLAFELCELEDRSRDDSRQAFEQDSPQAAT